MQMRPALIAILRRNTIWWVLAALVLTMALLSDVFLTPTNLLNILRQVSIMGIVAVGVTFVLIGGHFDLSVGAMLGLAAVMAVNLQPVTLGATVAAVVFPLLAGAGAGAVNGLLVGRLGANSIVVTVGSMYAVTAVTLMYIGGQHVWVWEPHPLFVQLGAGYVLGFPVPALVFLVVAAAGHLLMTRTTYGQYVYAAGANPTAAAMAGVPVRRTRALTFVISGLAAALAGVVLAARVKNLDPTAGAGYEFDAITAAVLGGTSLLGGRGSVLSTVAGVIVLGVLGNSMTLLNLSYHYQLVVRGIILVVAVSADVLARRGAR